MGLNARSLSRFRSLATESLVEVFSEKLEALGEDVTFAVLGTVRMLKSDGDFTRELVEGGFAAEGTIRLRFLAADLPVLPVIGSGATYDDRPYRVKMVTLTPGASLGTVELRPGAR